MDVIERGLIPDPLIRFGIRQICGHRLRELGRTAEGGMESYLDAMRRSNVAEKPESANTQHYEVPAEFFEAVLGPRLKYSCCSWIDGAATLADAEERALQQVVERAELQDGQRILELGCGWGSLTLYMSERFPNSEITAVSNSRGQRELIERRASQKGLSNVRVLTADVNSLELPVTFDRVVSVEMFEHMRNWEALLARIGSWLEPSGKLFIHIFAHRTFAYFYEDKGPTDWMARHFFTGGQMPSEELLRRFDRELVVSKRWRIGGEHYAKTANAWLANLDERREVAITALEGTEEDRRRAFQRWRIFFMACAELFAYRRGQEWGVSHYLMESRVAP